MKEPAQWFGVWCKDRNKNRGDWAREPNSGGVILFASKRKAMSFAAGEYGFSTYTEAKRRDWVEVRPFDTSDRRGVSPTGDGNP